MLSVPCGLPTYVGAWPPVAPGAELIEPMADLAASTPHSSCSSGGGEMYGRPPDEAERADEDSALGASA
jgi:hypothetical protein